MELFLQFILLFVGIFLLWKMGEVTVKNAIGFSFIYGIESFTIGFFIFAISTGLPEISSAIVSSVKKVPELSAGDLLGSTFVNTSLILGIVTLVAKEIEIEKHLRKQLLGTIGCIILIFFGTSVTPRGNIFTGLLLILIYFGAAFWFHMGMPKKAVVKEISEVEEKIIKEEKKALLPPKIDILLKLIGSLASLILSSWLMIYAATNIAERLHFQLSLMGATFIAVGTSLPELSLCIHAIRRKEYGLALGDIFGASLLNVSLVLGLLILMNPNLNIGIAKWLLPFVVLTFLWFVFKPCRKRKISLLDGWIFVGIFVIYLLTMVYKALSFN
jgi:cation:H+ antiporter